MMALGTPRYCFRATHWRRTVAFTVLVLAICGCATQPVRPPKPYFAISPEPVRVAFAGPGAGGADLYVADLASHEVLRVTHTPEREGTPEWTPDGKGLVYSRQRLGSHDYGIWHLTLGGAAHAITEGTGVQDATPDVSPDGRTVLFSRATALRQYSMGGKRWYDWDVYAVRIEGGEPWAVTNRRQYSAPGPRWLPDGQRYLFEDDTVRLGRLSGEVSRLKLPGGKQGAYNPDASPIGEGLVFLSDAEQDYRPRIHLARLDATQARVLTDEVLLSQIPPRYGPDGKFIYFFEGGLYRVNITTSEVTLLLPAATLQHPASAVRPAANN